MVKTFLPLLFTLLAARIAAGAEENTKDRREKMRSLYQEARTAQVEKKYARSNELLQQLIKLLPAPEGTLLDPNFARVYYDMGSNHALLGNKKEALENLDLAVKSGLWDHEFLSRDSSLKSLHEEKEFTALVERSRRALADVAFGLKDLSGKEIQKKDYEGKVLIVDIWGTWCYPCRLEIPHFVKLQEKYRKDGLAVIGLTWERRPPDDAVKKNVERFCKENNVNYTVAMVPDAILGSIPGFSGFPTTFYIGRDGAVANRVGGAEDIAAIEEKVVKLLNQKAEKR